MEIFTETDAEFLDIDAEELLTTVGHNAYLKLKAKLAAVETELVAARAVCKSAGYLAQKANQITAPWRHGVRITCSPENMDKLSNAQIDTEEAIALWNKAKEAT